MTATTSTPNRNQRATKNSQTADPNFNFGVGKAAKEKRGKVTIPANGEIRTNDNGVEYIYLPRIEYGEPVRRF